MRLLIIGAGVFGLCAAYRGARAGFAVTVLEAASAPALGASGGIVGALSPHTPDQWNPKKAFQFEALSMAEGFWSALESVSGLPTGYGRIGRVQPLMSLRQRVQAEARRASATAHWGSHFTWEVLEADPSGQLSPEASPHGVIHETLSARLHPQKACAALYAACQRLGVCFHFEESVREIVPGIARTERSAHHADHIILAAGLGGFALVNCAAGALLGSGVKGQAALLGADLCGMPQIYADGFYMIPHADGTVAIGSTSENSYDAPDATDAKLDALIAQACRLCPSLLDAPVLARWAGVRPKARRRDPLLGALPQLPSVSLALGGFKIGFGIAPLVAERLICALEEGRAPEFPPSFSLAYHLEGLELEGLKD